MLFDEDIVRNVVYYLIVTSKYSKQSLLVISYSSLSITDGDQMSSSMTLDNKMTRAALKLAPHINGFTLNAPFEVSSHVWIPKPTIATLSNYMHDPEHNQADPSKLVKMQTMFH